MCPHLCVCRPPSRLSSSLVRPEVFAGTHVSRVGVPSRMGTPILYTGDLERMLTFGSVSIQGRPTEKVSPSFSSRGPSFEDGFRRTRILQRTRVLVDCFYPQVGGAQERRFRTRLAVLNQIISTTESWVKIRTVFNKLYQDRQVKLDRFGRDGTHQQTL